MKSTCLISKVANTNNETVPVAIGTFLVVLCIVFLASMYEKFSAKTWIELGLMYRFVILFFNRIFNRKLSCQSNAHIGDDLNSQQYRKCS